MAKMNKYFNQDGKDDIPIIDLNRREIKELISEVIKEHFKKYPDLLQPSSSPDRKFWTRSETAARLSITLPTLYEWTKMGKLKSYKIGRRILYKPEEVEKALKEQVIRVRG